jgi:hypothetical protein
MQSADIQRKALHNSRWPDLGALLYFGVLTVILTYPVLPEAAQGVNNTGDPLLNAWILNWDVHALLSQPLNLYHANIFFPYPLTLAYSEALLGSVVLAAPIILLTHNPIFAGNVLTLLGFALSGWGTYLLVKRFTENRLAALIAGTIFAFNPYRFSQISHLQLVTVQWIPFIFLFLDRWFEKRRWRDWSGLCLAFNLQFLSSYYTGLFVALALGIMVFGYLLLYRRAFGWRVLWPLGLLGAISIAINVPLALPYLQVSQAMNFTRSLDDAVAGSARLSYYLGAAPGNWLYGEVTAALRGERWSEHSLFFGLVALGLAALGLVTVKTVGRRRGLLLLYAIMTLIGLILSFGPERRMPENPTLWLPYRLLYDYVPGFAAIRVPARFAIIVSFGVAVLAGFGAAFLLKRVRWRAATTGFICAAITLEAASLPIPLTPIAAAEQTPEVYYWLAQQPGKDVVLELPMPYPWITLGYTEAPRVYYSAVHGKQLINGYSGFFPPVYERIVGISQQFQTPELIEWLQGLRVNWLILHRDRYSPQEWARVSEKVKEFPNVLEPFGWFGDAWVLRVHPPEWEAGADAQRPKFGKNIRLLGYTSDGGIKPGDAFTVRLYWQAVGYPDKDYTAFVHLLDSKGQLVAQHDGPPQNGQHLTSAWRDGEVVIDEHRIHLPADLKSGQYQLQVGLYDSDTIERLLVRATADSQLSDALRLARLSSIP